MSKRCNGCWRAKALKTLDGDLGNGKSPGAALAVTARAAAVLAAAMPRRSASVLIPRIDRVRRRFVLEEYRGVSDVSVVGCVGSLIVATRGVAGPGEVLLTVRGSKEAYLAWSEEPLPKGTEVLVIDIRGARTVLVEPWPGLDFFTQIS
jgi:membrane protein implicated in regulation of membrane protease activity